MVALAESALADLEDEVDGLSRNVDPQTAPRAYLPWIAGWQGSELPTRATTQAAMRDVVRLIPELNERRGTCSGLIDLIEVHTGVRVFISERFRARRVWTLGQQSQLGAETMLASRDVGGFVLDDDRLSEAGPEDPGNTGSELFDDWAHRITVIVPCVTLTSTVRRLIAVLVEREKPAHVIADLCWVGPGLTVGQQARLGIDAVVGMDDPTGKVGVSRLDIDARSAAGEPDHAGAGHLGLDATLG
jgi:phage tail-like protein